MGRGTGELWLRVLRLMSPALSSLFIHNLDILPMPKGREFPLSRVRLPGSTRAARLGFHRTRSYALSAGSHGLSSRQHVSSSIDIAIMDGATSGTRPSAYRQI